MQPFSDEQLNFFKFSSLVLNEFPKALRQTFKTMWDNTYGHLPGFHLWDDSRLEKKIDELNVGRDEHDNLPDNSGKILRNCSSHYSSRASVDSVDSC